MKIPELTRRAGSTEGAICSQTLARDGTPKKSYFPKYHFSTVSQTLLRPVLHHKNTSKILIVDFCNFWRLFERYTREDALTAKGFFFGTRVPFFRFLLGKILNRPRGRSTFGHKQGSHLDPKSERKK